MLHWVRDGRNYPLVKSDHLMRADAIYAPLRKWYMGVWGGVFFAIGRQQGTAHLLAEMFGWWDVNSNETAKTSWFAFS